MNTTDKMKAMSIVLDHWVRESNQRHRRAFTSKLNKIYHDRECLIVMEELRRLGNKMARAYQQGEDRALEEKFKTIVMIYKFALSIKNKIKTQPCRRCGGATYLEPLLDYNEIDVDIDVSDHRALWELDQETEDVSIEVVTICKNDKHKEHSQKCMGGYLYAGWGMPMTY